MFPEFSWYQTKTNIHIQVSMNQVNSIDEDKVNVIIQDNKLLFHYENYNVEQELYQKAKITHIRIKNRYINLILEKDTSEFWNYLFTEKWFNKSYVKVDWNNWVDEDELDETENEPSPTIDDQSFNMEQFNEIMKNMNMT